MSLRDHVPEPWSTPQRRVIVAILLALVIYASIRLLMNRAYISDPQPSTSPRAAELADRIDPNTADAATIAVLPLVGEKRAAEIVAYRERFQRNFPGETAFKSPEDLLKIRGIGVATLEQMKPYLSFPKPNAAASPKAPTTLQ